LQIKGDGLTGDQYRERFLARLEGTLRAQEIYATTEPIELRDLIQQAIGENVSERVDYRGPNVVVEPAKVVALSMMFHELVTNSLKYGALSTSEGKVSIGVSLEPDASRSVNVNCIWQEENGPEISAPQHNGFGTQLMQRMASHVGGTLKLVYHSHGLKAVINLPSDPE
jgi:two-component sensor histidine kinase